MKLPAKRRRFVVCVTVAAAVAALLPASSSQAALDTQSGNYMRNVASRKCLEIGGFNRQPYGPAVQYTCVFGDNQEWWVRPFRAGLLVRAWHTAISEHPNDSCLGVPGASTEDGVLVVQLPCDNGDNVIWLEDDTPVNAPPAIAPLYEDSFKLRNLFSGKCLSLAGPSTADWAPVVQRACDGAGDQRWQTVPYKNPYG